MRHLALISVLAILVAGCGATGPSPSAPVQTASPTVTPAASPAPSVVAGWPVTAQGAFTMTGRDIEEEAWDGSGPGNGSGPVIEVRVTGRLAPGEVVALKGTGMYDRVVLCGPLPSRCGSDADIGEECLPEYGTRAQGLVDISAEPTVDANGSATATLRFRVPETEAACPVAGGDPGWLPWSGVWWVRVTDPVHGLMLVPEMYEWGP